MAVHFYRPPAARMPVKPQAVCRTTRKIALLGSHSGSLIDAPWGDPTWEFWGHASSHDWYARQPHVYFDLHVKACWTRGGKKGADYPTWLSRNTTPIYMQERYAEVPASIKYPRNRILQEFAGARRYFTNQVAWMIALALSEGVTTLGLWGINYGTEGEYMCQRGSAEYWLGRLEGAGVRLIMAEQSTLLREPALLYGYESHDKETGILRPEYQAKEWRPEEQLKPGMPPNKIAEPSQSIKDQIAEEEQETPRPDFAQPPKGWNGKPAEA